METRRDPFVDLFRDLAVAGRAVASYPRAHPATVGGLTRAHASLTALLQETGPIELGAARDALLWSDQRFTSPGAAQLARLLRRRRAATLSLDPGVTPEELETLLRALSVDARTAGDSGSFSAELAAAGLVGIRVSDLDFSSVALVEGEADEEAAVPLAGAFAERVAARLLASGAVPADALSGWIGSGRGAADLLRLLYETSGSAEGLGTWGPAAFAAAVVAEAEERQALGGGAAAKGPGGEEAEVPDAHRLAAGQVATLRRAFATDDVDTFRDACEPARMLAALLDLPEEADPSPVPPEADAIRLELLEPSSEGESAPVLLELAERPEVAPEALPAILARFLLGFRRLVAGGRFRQAIALVDRVQRRAAAGGPAAVAFRDCASAMAESDAIDALVAPLADLPEELLPLVASLVQRLDPVAVRHLLGVLARTENRRTRFRLLDLLAGLGPMVARDAEAMLSDPRWYVVRNMLLLLRRVGDSKSVPSVRRCVDHADLRVRLEAIHNLFAFDKVAPSQLLRRAIHHADPRQAEAAMELVGKYGITVAVGPIVEYLSSWDPFGRRRGARLKAIRALAALGDPAALRGLTRFRARFRPFGPAIEERRELYRTLPAYPEESYQDWIASGLRSRDPEIRRLSAAMGPAPGSTS